ncbi:MAG: FtsX-like permease family protein [Bdellovibrionota bacterium]
MKLILHYALKELIHNRKFSIFFIANLSVGLFAFVTLFGFQSSLTRTLSEKSKKLLGADLGVSARRPLQVDEVKVVENELGLNFKKTHLLETYSMVRSVRGQSRLFQIKAIEDNYPFYGQLTVSNQSDQAISRLFDNGVDNVVWVYPEVLLQLEIKVGDVLLIGEQTFTIEGVINNDETRGMTSDFAPRIYMSITKLLDTGLVRPGSLVWYSTLYQINSAQRVDALQKRIFAAMDQPDIRVFTHQDSSQQMARLMNLLSDFLGLAAMVALFLAAVGLYFLFQTFLHQRHKQYSILMTLGVSYAQTVGLVVFQVFVLGLIGSLLSLLMAWSILPMSIGLIAGMLPFDLAFGFDWKMIAYGLALGIVGSIAICLPVLSQLKDVQLNTLLQEQPIRHQNTTLLYKGLMVGNMLLFWMCSMVVANSVKVGSLFFMLFVSSMALLAILAKVFFQSMESIVLLPNIVPLRWAWKDITRNQFVTMISFLSIGLGVVYY